MSLCAHPLPCLLLATDHQSHSEGHRARPDDHTARPARRVARVAPEFHRCHFVGQPRKRLRHLFRLPTCAPQAARGPGRRRMAEPEAEGAGMPADLPQLLPQPSSARLQPSFTCEGKKLSRTVKGPIFHPARAVTSESAKAVRILAEAMRLLSRRRDIIIHSTAATRAGGVMSVPFPPKCHRDNEGQPGGVCASQLRNPKFRKLHFLQPAANKSVQPLPRKETLSLRCTANKPSSAPEGDPVFQSRL